MHASLTTKSVSSALCRWFFCDAGNPLVSLCFHESSFLLVLSTQIFNFLICCVQDHAVGAPCRPGRAVCAIEVQPCSWCLVFDHPCVSVFIPFDRLPPFVFLFFYSFFLESPFARRPSILFPFPLQVFLSFFLVSESRLPHPFFMPFCVLVFPFFFRRSLNVSVARLTCFTSLS